MPTTIFWPADVRVSGFCYGWKQPAYCVAGVLNLNEEREAERTLEVFHSSSHRRLLSAAFSVPLTILGRCTFDSHHASRGFIRPSLQMKDVNHDFHLIFYHRHSTPSLRFYSLHGLKLDPAEQPVAPKASPYARLLDCDFTASHQFQREESLDILVIDQLNIAKAIDLLLIQQYTSPRREIRASLLRILHSVGAYLATPLIGPTLAVSHLLASLCGLPVVWFSSPRLKDISATVQQLDVRAEQAAFFVSEIPPLNKRTSTPLPLYAALYMNFFNTVWLLINDVAIGYTFGVFLCENNVPIADFLNRVVEGSFISWVQWVLCWLDSWPAGLKLNTELSRFFSHTFIEVIALWGGILGRGRPYLSNVIFAAGVLSYGGMTVLISICMDALALLTIHIYLCYFISNIIYQKMLQTAGSLWNLFRGKRFNVLRNWTDNWEYDMDQLLFGTILFTLLAFLFPTVLAYYALFAVMRLGVIALQACLETLLAFMNHFPLFALMLRVKDPWRLPGGICFKFKPQADWPNPVMVIENQPVSLTSIFFQYIRLSSLLASHYNPLRLLYCVLSGQYLAPIPRYSIRYNKIPPAPQLSADLVDSLGYQVR